MPQAGRSVDTRPSFAGLAPQRVCSSALWSDQIVPHSPRFLCLQSPCWPAAQTHSPNATALPPPRRRRGNAEYTTVQAAVDQLPATGGTSSSPPAPTASRSSSISPTSPSRAPAPVRPPPSSSMTPVRALAAPSPATLPSTFSGTISVRRTHLPERLQPHARAGLRGSQAQALNLEGDRNLLDHVHILANQDTLYIGAKGCGQSGSLRLPPPSSSSFPPSAHRRRPQPAAPCIPTLTRSYFTHCVVAGNVDFIYGDANAVFNDCEIHSPCMPPAATSPRRANTSKTSNPPSSSIIATSLPSPASSTSSSADPGETTPRRLPQLRDGRPHRTRRLERVDPRRHPPARYRLYAEYNSTGPGANPSARVPNRTNSPAQAKQYETARFLAGSDHWNPRS